MRETPTELVSVFRTAWGRRADKQSVSENKQVVEQKRKRRSYDAAFKRAAVEHYMKHGSDLSRASQVGH